MTEIAIESHPRRTNSATRGARTLLPSATLSEMLGVAAGVIAPTVAKGVIIRRPLAMAIAEWLDVDARAVRRLQRLRNKYRGPLLLGPLRGRYWSLVLSPDDARRVLEGTPSPFATASAEKIAALSHFEPKSSLISQGIDRTVRRAFNEAILQTDRPVHAMADTFAAVVAEETDELLRTIDRTRGLTWSAFSVAWFRVVRRIVFGDAARNDREITDLLAHLRSHANWAFLWPTQHHVRDRFLDCAAQLLRRGEPGSLAAAIAAYSPDAQTAAVHQIPQWLFAFDAAGMAIVRTMALLATHPVDAARVRDEIRNASTAHNLGYLRACVLESLRLWPTTPLVLRQSVEETQWADGMMPAQTGVIIFAPFFHRDDERLPFANRFAPDIWLQERPAEESWMLMPFSEGPARCPGRQLVELLASTMISGILDGRAIRLLSSRRLHPEQALAGTLNHFSLRFAIEA
jgi:cytochrome P450